MEGTAPLHHSVVADFRLRQRLVAFVRRRVPAGDVDDIVQTTLCEALEREVPKEPSEAERYVLGIARHKIVDLYRRRDRTEGRDDMGPVEEPSCVENASLVDWATRSAGSSEHKTLGWLWREGNGDSLEEIAQDEKIKPAAVRQRVSRLRRKLRELWLLELSAAGLLVVWLVWRAEHNEPTVIVPEPSAGASGQSAPPTLADASAALRRRVLDACERGLWSECEVGLDELRVHDPASEATPEIQRARAQLAAVAHVAGSPSPPVKSAGPPAKNVAPTPKPQQRHQSTGSKSGNAKALFDLKASEAAKKVDPSSNSPRQQK